MVSKHGRRPPIRHWASSCLRPPHGQVKRACWGNRQMCTSAKNLAGHKMVSLGEMTQRQDNQVKLTCGLISLLDLLCVPFHQELIQVWIAQKSLPMIMLLI